LSTTAGRASSWRGLTFVALIALAVVLILTQVLAGGVIPPLLAFAGLFSVFAVVARRNAARWPLIVVAVLVVAYVAAAVPFFVADLSHPESAATFIPAELSLIAALLALVGALGSLSGRSSRAPRALGVAGVVVAIAGAAWAVVATSRITDDTPGAGDVAIEVRDVRYPDRVEIPAGGAAVFVTNADPFRHTFVVDGHDVHRELPASSSKRFDVTLAAGTYRLYCDVPGHEQMQTSLVVQ
jgi:plastocyanin